MSEVQKAICVSDTPMPLYINVQTMLSTTNGIPMAKYSVGNLRNGTVFFLPSLFYKLGSTDWFDEYGASSALVPALLIGLVAHVESDVGTGCEVVVRNIILIYRQQVGVIAWMCLLVHCCSGLRCSPSCRWRGATAHQK